LAGNDARKEGSIPQDICPATRSGTEEVSFFKNSLDFEINQARIRMLGV